MASVTLSEYLLRSVIWFSIAALVLMLLLLLSIFRLRIGLIARKEHERLFIEAWQPRLAAAIAGDKNDLPPLAKDDVLLFLKLWNHLHESLRGHARVQLNIIALRLGILEQTYALLQGRSRGLTLLALTTLGNLRAHHGWAAILEYSRHPDPLLSLTAAHALFQIDAEAALRDLKQQLIERADWPAAYLMVLLKEADKEAIYTALTESAVHMAASANPVELTRLNRLLLILQAAPYQIVIPAIRTILSQPRDDETLAQCLKFLREPADLTLVHANLTHPNWVVRLQVAQALGRFGSANDTASLTALMGDPVWWVRYRAAHALMALTQGDPQTLSDLRTHLTDHFALNMLDMVMAEKEQK